MQIQLNLQNQCQNIELQNEDRIAVEHVLIETKEALPEPTEEELKQKAKEYLAAYRIQQWCS